MNYGVSDMISQIQSAYSSSRNNNTESSTDRQGK